MSVSLLMRVGCLLLDVDPVASSEYEVRSARLEIDGLDGGHLGRCAIACIGLGQV